MSTRPDARRRLAELMEERRLDLGLFWQDVVDAAVAAGFRLSLKTLHSVRAGTAGIRPMTKRAIEVGLQWEHGSIQRIEDGGDPVPVSATPTPPPPAVPQPPRATAEDAGDDVTRNIMVAAGRPEERRIWAGIRERLETTPAGARLLADPAQAALWPPETGDGRWGGTPVELTPEAVRVLDSTPADMLCPDPVDNAAIRLVMYPWPDRVAMAAAMRGRLGRPTSAARRAG